MAHLQAFAGNEPENAWGGRKGGSRTSAARKLRVTLDLYTQSVSSQKRVANTKLVEMLLPSLVEAKKPQHPSAPSEVLAIAVSY
jgi:hypothetical protein